MAGWYKASNEAEGEATMPKGGWNSDFGLNMGKTATKLIIDGDNLKRTGESFGSEGMGKVGDGLGKVGLGIAVAGFAVGIGPIGRLCGREMAAGGGCARGAAYIVAGARLQC